MKRERIAIESYIDLLDIMEEMVDDFLEDFVDRKGLTREPNEDDYFDWDDNQVSFIYTGKGMNLYDTYVRRLGDLFNKHFPLEEFEINPSNIIHL